MSLNYKNLSFKIMELSSVENNNIIQLDNYYKILNIKPDTPLEDINKICQEKIIHYKSLPFLIDSDKIMYKHYKKAFYIFNNQKYRIIYDKYIKNTDTKKSNLNQSYVHDRIFSLSSNSKFNLENNHNLRPQNVGLLSDDKPNFDIPLNFDNTYDNNFLPNTNNNFAEL
jgi:hypothetical protein